jgi:MFS superfamily sulfate permease-like transporter
VDIVGIVAGIVAGGALVWAGFLKLREGPDWAKQAADMGVARSVALVVPYVEVAVGALLASTLLSPWPAMCALVLFASFTVLIVLRILDGSRPPCSCFGSRSKRPIGARDVARNVLLMVLTVVAMVWS